MHERFANAYDPFVIPYMIGFVFVIAYLVVALCYVVKQLPLSDKKKMLKHLFSYKIFITVKDIIADCLLHVKIWKKNKYFLKKKMKWCIVFWVFIYRV